MASYVVTKLAEMQIDTEPVVSFDVDHYQVFLNRLIEHEELVYGSANDVQVSCFSVNFTFFMHSFQPHNRT